MLYELTERGNTSTAERVVDRFYESYGAGPTSPKNALKSIALAATNGKLQLSERGVKQRVYMILQEMG